MKRREDQDSSQVPFSLNFKDSEKKPDIHGWRNTDDHSEYFSSQEVALTTMSVLINRKQDRSARRGAVTAVPLLNQGGHGAHYEEAPPCDSSVSPVPLEQSCTQKPRYHRGEYSWDALVPLHTPQLPVTRNAT